MVSALVFSPPGRLQALGLTLAALVRGVTEGAVADAVLVLRAPDAEVELVADEAGATLVLAAPPADPWSAAAARARRDVVLCLEAGDVPGAGWTEAVGRFAAAAASGRLGRLRREGAGLGVRTLGLAEALAGARRPRSGDVLDRRLLARLPFRPALRPVRLPAPLVRAAAGRG